MNKEEHLQKIMQLLAESANIHSAATKLGKEYTDKYCPYKPGDKVIIKPNFGQQEYGIISWIRFDEHSELEGLCALQVYPYTKNWERKKERRSNINISEKSELIKHIKA